ncbi:hypothetical protein NIES37_45190 [Tolypothrix tenuis PCC 7101]|uniref:Uncharacterized protein n=1 Tax=Tolypothrix tenuis PCC 7101 TaxID=231146 RepID=A0A1Z4N469_9CYAN|nr:hypothetical protein [Aulosira sp. FACHB-113]BAZ00524.1 hypothetical protein NIES37_45190 [Tolypothrix tenuis PCC 7101]BAZ75554.1 hypothetical protein NIES50_41370 [Aulosira laxa NIES-50]
MPRGVPTSGKRAPGGGRPKKYGEDTVQVRVPASIAPKLDDLYLFLAELDAEIQQWEQEINNKDISKNPRYSKAKLLAESIREKISALGIDIKTVTGD